MKYLQYFTIGLFCLFACIGILFSSVFVGQRLHVFNVKGMVDPHSSLFSITNEQLKNYAIPQVQASNIETTAAPSGIPTNIWCAILAVKDKDSGLAEQLNKTFQITNDQNIVLRMMQAAQVSDPTANFTQPYTNCTQTLTQHSGQGSVYAWKNVPEWSVFKTAITSEKDNIIKAAAEAQIDPRLLVGVVMGEQMRFYTSNRASYKQYFEPLKILGNLTLFSYGVSGMKIETAQKIEAHLADTTSPYYLGPQFEHVLDFSTADAASERFNRLTDKSNHYYSLLYAALALKQIEAQWSKAGFPIEDRPEITGTLYNLGFERSVPKANPEVGGAGILLGETTYSFGRLVYEFYYSGELVDEFPYKVQ